MSATVVEGRIPFRGHETWYRVFGDRGSAGLPLVFLHGEGKVVGLLFAADAAVDDRPQ